jgi:hypothetical protein
VALEAHLSAWVWLIRREVAQLWEVSQLELVDAHRPTYVASGAVPNAGCCDSACALGHAVDLLDGHAKHDHEEVLDFLGQRGAARNDKLDLTSKEIFDLLKDHAIVDEVSKFSLSLDVLELSLERLIVHGPLH